MPKSKLVLIIGSRLSGKTHKAVELALASGKLVGAVAPTKRMAENFQTAHGILTYAASTQRPAHQAWGVLIVDDAHLISSTRFLRMLGDVSPHSADVIVTACPPTKKRGEWVLKLKEVGFTVKVAS